MTFTDTAVMRFVRAARPEGAPIIEFKHVSKAYGQKRVLDDVNLSVMRGEVLVILGGSGTGKSVSLRHMNGLERPDSGKVWVDGVEVFHPDVDEASRDAFTNVARFRGKMVTGGSDDHGTVKKKETLGTIRVPEDLIGPILDRMS